MFFCKYFGPNFIPLHFLKYFYNFFLCYFFCYYFGDLWSHLNTELSKDESSTKKCPLGVTKVSQTRNLLLGEKDVDSNGQETDKNRCRQKLFEKINC